MVKDSIQIGRKKIDVSNSTCITLKDNVKVTPTVLNTLQIIAEMMGMDLEELLDDEELWGIIRGSLTDGAFKVDDEEAWEKMLQKLGANRGSLSDTGRDFQDLLVFAMVLDKNGLDAGTVLRGGESIHPFMTEQATASMYELKEISDRWSETKMPGEAQWPDNIYAVNLLDENLSMMDKTMVCLTSQISGDTTGLGDIKAVIEKRQEYERLLKTGVDSDELTKEVYAIEYNYVINLNKVEDKGVERTAAFRYALYQQEEYTNEVERKVTEYVTQNPKANGGTYTDLEMDKFRFVIIQLGGIDTSRPMDELVVAAHENPGANQYREENKYNLPFLEPDYNLWPRTIDELGSYENADWDLYYSDMRDASLGIEAAWKTGYNALLEKVKSIGRQGDHKEIYLVPKDVLERELTPKEKIQKEATEASLQIKEYYEEQATDKGIYNQTYYQQTQNITVLARGVQAGASLVGLDITTISIKSGMALLGALGSIGGGGASSPKVNVNKFSLNDNIRIGSDGTVALSNSNTAAIPDYSTQVGAAGLFITSYLAGGTADNIDSIRDAAKTQDMVKWYNSTYKDVIDEVEEDPAAVAPGITEPLVNARLMDTDDGNAKDDAKEEAGGGTPMNIPPIPPKKEPDDDKDEGSGDEFNNPADPIRDILGPGSKSHPEEWNRMIKELQESGIEIIYRENMMAYSPHPSINGNPGQFFIDPNASISALKHEFNHFKQAQAAGFPNMSSAFGDTAGRIANEISSYDIEIKIAEDLGLENVANQLKSIWKMRLN